MTKLLLKIFVKDYKNTKDETVRERYGALGSFMGIFCNLLLFILKLILGLISGSVSIMADAFNNLSDIGSSVVTLLGFKLSKKPADPDHPFGHGRMEYMSAFIVAVLILLVGAELFKSSVSKIFSPEPLNISLITVIGLIISIAVKLWMSFFSRKLSKLINSGSLKATAQDSLNDCISTSCVLISIIIYKFTDLNLDPYMGVLVALFILWSGFSSAKETMSPLLGEPPSKELIDGIKNGILKYKEFSGLHDLIVHNYGPGRCFASVHVEVPADINVLKCHELIDRAESEISAALGIEIVMHMDPIAVDDSGVTETYNALLEKVHTIDSRLALHDFRMVEGENRINLVFDVVVPPDFQMSKAELKSEICDLVREIDERYCCVIQVDIDLTGTL